MHKLLMVDDEELIRTGFREKIDWRSLGFEFLEPCSNGLQALQAVVRQRPDVVMTDICMPQMDGLELCRILARDHPEVRVVVLSGHDDFEYAREALRNRVVEYLLKPVTSVELKAFLQGLAGELARPRLWTEAEALLRLVEGAVPESGLTWEGGSAEAGASWAAGRLNLFVPEAGPPGVLERVEGVLGERERPRQGLAAATLRQGGRVVHIDLAYPGTDPDHASLRAAREASKLLAAFRRAGFRSCGALGGAGPPREWASHREEAALASLLRFFRPGLLVTGVAAWSPPLPQSAVEGWSQRLETLLREGDRVALAACVDDFRRLLRSDAGNALRLGHDLARLWGPEGTAVLEACPTATELVAALEDLIHGTLAAAAERGATLADRALKRLREHIDRHLGEPELSIVEVSQHLQVSPSYLAKLLRRKWGTSFSQYLREARVSRAKELLAATNLTTTRIAEQTGFHDYRYFSNQFKRSAGLTPSGYRSQIRAS